MKNYDAWKIGRATYTWRRYGNRLMELEALVFFFTLLLWPMLNLFKFFAPSFLLGIKKREHKKKMQEIRERKTEYQEMVDRINKELDEEFGVGGED